VKPAELAGAKCEGRIIGILACVGVGERGQQQSAGVCAFGTQAPRARRTELVPFGRRSYAVRFGDTRRTGLDRIGQYGANLPKNSVGRTAQKPPGLIFAFHSICLPTEYPVERA
jgi:hypothetical protein